MHNKHNNVSNLKSHIGYHLRVVSNAVSHTFARKLAVSDVTVAEWVILREMYSISKVISSSEIAEVVGLTRGAVSKLMDRLLVKGLVIRSESSKDRRYQEITLSKKGVELVPTLAEIADENDDNFFSVLTELERKKLIHTLIKLTKVHNLHGSPIE